MDKKIIILLVILIAAAVIFAAFELQKDRTVKLSGVESKELSWSETVICK